MDPLEDFCTFRKDFFDCGAAELARNLLGKYLWCPRSDINGMIRIVETEAFPEGDDVYRKIFGDGATQQSLPNQAGVVVRLNFGLHARSTASTATYPDHMYITAEGKAVVRLRSCMLDVPDQRDKMEKLLGYSDKTPDLQRKNLLIHPHNVAKGLSKDWGISGPVHYNVQGGFLLLACNTSPVYAEMHGKRVLDKTKFPSKYASSGTESKYRFALLTEEMYIYMEPKELHFINPTAMTPYQISLAQQWQQLTQLL